MGHGVEADHHTRIRAGVLDGVRDARRDQEPMDRSRGDVIVARVTLFTNADQRRPYDDQNLGAEPVEMVAPHLAGLCQHHVHVLLPCELIPTDWLEHQPPDVATGGDLVNLYFHGCQAKQLRARVASGKRTANGLWCIHKLTVLTDSARSSCSPAGVDPLPPWLRPGTGPLVAWIVDRRALAGAPEGSRG